MPEKNIDDIIIEEEKNEADKIKDLRDELKKCESERMEYLAGWQRTKADFINYKNEIQKEFLNLKSFALEDFLRNFLPILDSFDRAVENISVEDAGKKWTEGILNIKKQFSDFLESQGLEEIENIVGKKFDPLVCEAIITEKQEGAEEDIVLEVLQKGYKLSGKVIRPAKVKISIK